MMETILAILLTGACWVIACAVDFILEVVVSE